MVPYCVISHQIIFEYLLLYNVLHNIIKVKSYQAIPKLTTL